MTGNIGSWTRSCESGSLFGLIDRRTSNFWPKPFAVCDKPSRNHVAGGILGGQHKYVCSGT